jgi:thiamine-phosphate diphosphorylase / hydroxyethylthiazole kinase
LWSDRHGFRPKLQALKHIKNNAHPSPDPRAMDKTKIDYSLYLVTDSGLLSPSATSFEDHVKKLADGGVTIVQLREKSLSTADFVKRGKQLLSVTKGKGIPLIVNDRLDVALAIDADGVHLGQDDMGRPPELPILF